jgi:rfaE bifunctional protein nucleotidyltransferase chain/domain
MRSPESKIVTWENLEPLASTLSSKGLRVISTNGCFDILHSGHIEYLSAARSLGDVLVVGINSDDSVRTLKGEGRPIQPESARAFQVAGLEAVDYVVVFNDAIPIRFLEILRPRIHVKGGDYEPSRLPEKEIVERSGGKVVCLPLIEGFSTSRLAQQIAGLKKS